MPLVRIDLREGASSDYRKALGDGVHRAMIEAFAIPPDDRFQVISEHPHEGLIYDRTYLGIQRSDKVVFVQIFFTVRVTFPHRTNQENSLHWYNHLREELPRTIARRSATACTAP